MRIIEREFEKADGFKAPEGCGSWRVMVSDEDTTGIAERGM
jgi:hypothetical protein